MITFDPTFFLPNKSVIDDMFIQGCVNSYCAEEKAEVESTLLTFDSYLVSFLLDKQAGMIRMETLCILFDFVQVMKTEIPKELPIHLLRKLFAISFFIPQLIRQKNEVFEKEMLRIVKILISMLKEQSEMKPLISSALSYLFYQIAILPKGLKLTKSLVHELVDLALELYNDETMKSKENSTHLIKFCFASIFYFSNSMEYDEKTLNTLTNLVTNYEVFFKNLPSPFDFNLMAFGDKLTTLLIRSLEIPMELKNNIYLTLSYIPTVLKHSSARLFDDQILKVISRYLYDSTKKMKTGFTKTIYVVPDFSTISSDAPETILPTFAEPIPVLKEEERVFVYEKKPTPEISPPQCFDILLKATIALIDSSSVEMKTKFIVYLLKAGTCAQFGYFIHTLFSRYMCLELISNLFKRKCLREYCRLPIRDGFYVQEMETYVSDLFIYFFQNCGKKTEFLSILYNGVCESLLDHTTPSSAIDAAYICLCSDPQRILPVLDSINFDSKLAKVLTVNRNRHMSALKEGNTDLVQIIEESRKTSFKIIDTMISTEELCKYLTTSIEFVEALELLLFEPNIRRFALSVLGRALSSLSYDEKTLTNIILFFNEQMANDEEIGKLILIVITNVFKKNIINLSHVFLHTSFINNLVEFAKKTGDDEDLFMLIDLFKNSTSLMGSMNEFLLETNPFISLLPFVSKGSKQGFDDQLIEKLYLIAYGEAKTKTTNRIKNAAPLSLVYHIMKKKGKLLDFLKSITQNCLMEDNSALALNNGDFPEQLINTIVEYRSKHEKDKIFDAVLNLLFLISSRSMKSKDLLSLFQTLSPLSGNYRPFFTMDVLNCLLKILNSKERSPPSFFSLTHPDDVIYIPDIELKESMTQFTFFINFLVKSFKGTLFQMISDYDTYLGIYFEGEKIIVQFKQHEKTQEVSFPISFYLNTWNCLVLVYKEGELKVYMNGKVHEQIGMPIAFTSFFKEGMIGKNLECHIGMFGMLRISLKNNYAKALEAFPLTLSTTFLEQEAQEFGARYNHLFDGTISNNAIYLYSPAVTQGQYGMNMVVNEFGRKMMKTSGNVYTFSPAAKHVIHSIGGIASVLPLFTQLDRPKLPKEGEEPQYNNEENYLLVLLQILGAFLSGSNSNQVDFYTIKGFHILNILISRARIYHINKEVIKYIFELYKFIDFQPLIHQLIEVIYLDMRLWIYIGESLLVFYLRSMNEFFFNLTQAQKNIFVGRKHIMQILYMIRTALWTEIHDPNICMYKHPKIDPITKEEEAKRPSNFEEILVVAWEFALNVMEYQLQINDALRVCLLTYDNENTHFTCESLRFISDLLKKRNGAMIEAIKRDRGFAAFVQHIISPYENIKIQLIRLFMTYSQLDKDSFVGTMTVENWAVGLCAIMNTENLGINFADTVFSYIVDSQSKVSECDLKAMFKIKSSLLLNIGLLAISDCEDSMSDKYLTAIDHAIQASDSKLSDYEKWTIPLLIYVLHRIDSHQGNAERSASHALKILSHLLAQMILYHGVDTGFTQIPVDLALFECTASRDFSFAQKHLYMTFIDEILIANSVTYEFDDFTIIAIQRQIFRYLFMMSDKGANFNLENPPWQEKITFQKLHNTLFFKTDNSTKIESFCYGTRSTVDGQWIDDDFAEHFVQFLLENKRLIEADSSIECHPLFMLTYTLGIGLQHIKSFPIFSKYIHIMIDILGSQDRITDLYVNCFVIFTSGIIKTYINTDQTHESHKYLHEISIGCNDLILAAIKTKVEWGDSFESFESCFKSSGHNFAHLIVEKFANDIEPSMVELVKSISKSYSKQIAEKLSNIKQQGMKFKALSVARCKARSKKINHQVSILLQKQVLIMRQSHSIGVKSYRNLIRNLSSENGPWFSPEMHVDHHFKLDKAMQKGYRRGRMRENFNFTDHMDASLLRDVGNIDDANDEYQKHLSRLRITSFTGDQSVVSTDDDETEDQIIGTKKSEDIILKIDAKLVTMRQVISGTFILTCQSIVFDSSKYVEVDLKSISHVFLRNYLQIKSAIEFYTQENRSYFFDFVQGQRKYVIREIGKMNLLNIKFLQSKESDLKEIVSKTQKQWLKGLYSNFDYLMALNIIAGRTYNDLSRYPVFPWILQDYESEVLDFDNPDIFRDLSLPIGAINQQRLEQIMERLNVVVDENESPYLYGSFYSSAAVVIGYMIRIEPFTSLHIELQSGKFDATDRLFLSIKRTWDSVNNFPMDFRELIPEFFYFPDFLQNNNHYNLGKGLQGDVDLPPWASSAQDFVAKHRAALESPYVTMNLPSWIDNIFGFSSRGEEALKHKNMFSPYFYEIPPDVLNDPKKLSFAQEYVACFGQAPTQIFMTPHARRKVHMREIVNQPPSINLLYESNAPVIAIDCQKNVVTIVNSLFDISVFKIDFATNTSTEHLHGHLPLSAKIENSDIYRMTNFIFSNRDRCISSVPWDSSFTVAKLKDPIMILGIKRAHTRNISMIAMTYNYFVTASLDGTIIIWKYPNTMVSILAKHKAFITAVGLNEYSDLVISVSRDGQLVSSSLSKGRFIRTQQVHGGEPSKIKLFPSGLVCIAVTKAERSSLQVMDQNLNLISELDFDSIIQCWTGLEWYDGYEYMVVSLSSQQIILIKLDGLKIIWKIEGLDFDITQMNIIKHPRYKLVMGTIYGQVLSLSLDQ